MKTAADARWTALRRWLRKEAASYVAVANSHKPDSYARAACVQATYALDHALDEMTRLSRASGPRSRTGAKKHG